MACGKFLNFNEFFCCILSPKLGAAINGVFLALLSLFGNIMILHTSFENSMNFYWLMLLQNLAITTFVASGLLIAGIRHEIPNLLLPWLVVIPFNCVLVCFCIWKGVFKTGGIWVIIALILFMAYEIYAWISAYTYFRQQVLKIHLRKMLPMTVQMINNEKKSNSLSTKVTRV